MNNGELTLNIGSKCDTEGCNCSNSSDIIASRNDTPEGAKGFFALVHEFRNQSGQTFTLKGTLHGGEELSTRYDIPGVKSVAVYYWEKDETYDKPLLLEVTLGVGGKKYYYKYDQSEVNNSRFWSHQRPSKDITLQVMLDDRNCGRNHAVPLNIKDPEAGTLPSNVGSNCLKNKRKIDFDGLKPLVGSEFVTTTYKVNGRDTKISRVTLNDISTDIPPITEVIEKIILYSNTSISSVPIAVLFQLPGEKSRLFYSKNSNGTEWGEHGNGDNIFYDKGTTPLPALSEQLDKLTCLQYKNVTLNLTKSHSDTHAKSKQPYCCEEHKGGKGGDGEKKISVTEGNIIVDSKKRTKYYKHSITTPDSSLAGIHYKDSYGQRKRIVLNTQNFPIKGSLTVSVFYCTGEIPVLICVDSGSTITKGWYKKGDGDTWTKILTGVPYPEYIKNCDNWNKLVRALRNAGCYNYSTCTDGTTKPLPVESGSADSIIPGRSGSDPATPPGAGVPGPDDKLDLATTNQLQETQPGIGPTGPTGERQPEVTVASIGADGAEAQVQQLQPAGTASLSGGGSNGPALPDTPSATPASTKAESEVAQETQTEQFADVASGGIIAILTGAGTYGGPIAGAGSLTGFGWWIYKRSKGDPWSNLLRVYVRTIDKELIEVSPSLQVPKSLDQFELILRDLKINRKVRSQNSSTILIKFVKNEMENILPPGSKNIGLSNTGTCVKLEDYLTKFKNVTLPLVFHVGAISTSQAHGTINDVEEIISISPHGLTAAHCCAKICNELVVLYCIFYYYKGLLLTMA